MDLFVDLVTIVALLLALVAPFVLVVLLARDIWRLLRPQQRILQGRYADARDAAERVAKSWMSVLPSVRRTTRYTIALALHLEGKLDEAIEILSSLREERLDPNLKYAVLSLEAGSLALAGRDATRAVSAIEEARAIRETREDVLIMTHALFDAGRHDEAKSSFERSMSMKEPSGTKLGRTLLYASPKLRAAIESYLRGTYLLKVGRTDDAQDDLEAAASGPPGNFYTDRARALLRPAPPTKDEEPASLAPHAMG